MTPMIVFDLDGTLLDCQPRQVALTRWLLEKRGELAFDAETFWLMKRNGASTEQSLAEIYRNPELAQSVAKEWKNLVELPEWLALDQPLPGALVALNQLHASGNFLALLTARTNAQGLRATLKRLEMHSFFCHIEVVDPAEATQKKADKLKAWKPAVFLGDTESDLKAANIAGTRFIALSWGQRSAGWLKSHGANACFPDMNSAIEYILEQLPDWITTGSLGTYANPQ